MAASPRAAYNCCRCASRTPFRPSNRPLLANLSIQRPRQAQTRRWESTTAAESSTSNPKIAGIVDQISQLTLLETADLVSSLKSRLNIPDMPMGGFGGGAGGGAGLPPPAAPVEEDEPAPKQEEKTLFNLKLESIDAAAKPKIIKEIKSMLGLSLVDSKKFVESLPKMMRESVPKDEAEKIIKTMKDLGGVASME